MASEEGALEERPGSLFRQGELVAGRFRIVRLLARGGMGEVYEAEDTDLGERVAVKVIRPDVAEDERSLDRFKREIQLARKVTHPNVCRTFDSVRFRPAGALADRLLVTMELLDGETLTQRLKRGGALTPAETLPLVEQMASALEAAHAAGIVHRDFKSSNVMLVDGTGAVRVVVTDFGLARNAVVGSSDSAGQATSAFIGTPEYMAPEQVEGGRITPAVDVYALGVVIYEMVTGARPFSGNTPLEVMVRRLKEPPLPPRALASGLPPHWEATILRCLEREPKQRFASAAEVPRSLAGGAPVSLSGAPTRARTTSIGASQSRTRRLAGATIAIAALALAFEGGRRLGARSRAGDAAVPSTFAQLTELSGREMQPSLSPDGKSFVYVASTAGNADIYLQRAAGGAATNLTADSPADDLQPAFAPDGERIAFRSERDGGGIFVMGAAGESIRRVSDTGYYPSWSPDGKEIVVSTVVWEDPHNRTGTGRLLALDVLSGKARVLFEGGDATQPSWSPHGRRVAFWAVILEQGSYRDLFTVAADGSEAKQAVRLTDDAATDWSPAWSADGRYLYFSSDRGGSMNLWRILIDEASGRPLGPPEPLTTPASWSGDISVSRDGRRVAFATLDWRASLQRLRFDPVKGETQGAPERVLSSTRPIRDHDISPDGQSIVFTRVGQQEDLFLSKIDGTGQRRLTDDRYRDRGPVWSPDGKTIAFYSDRGGYYAVWLIHPDGSGMTPLASVPSVGLNFPTWSPDGARLAAPYSRGSWYLFDVGRVPGKLLQGPMPKMRESTSFYPMAWSRDGQWLAGPRLAPGGVLGGIARYSFATGRYDDLYDDPTMRFGTAVWLSDSRRLLVRDQRGVLLLDAVNKNVRRLFAVSGFFLGRGLSMSRDDHLITYTDQASEGDIWLLDLK